MSLPKPVLTYFPGRGRAEAIRMALVEAEVDFEDHRFVFGLLSKQHPELVFRCRIGGI